MKVCFKCRELKPLSEFYKHPQMADGHLNKCKECAKRDVRGNNKVTRKERAAYEKERFQRPERKAKVLEYQRKRRAADPVKDKARQDLSRAVREGRIIKAPCQVCGTLKVEAHHTDYTKPLDVMWLCRVHHLEQHNKESYLLLEQPTT